jgi:hypothetical protein
VGPDDENLPVEHRARFPPCDAVRHAFWVGGRSKRQLQEDLARHAVQLNDAARQLFACDRFATAPSAARFAALEVTVRDLGFADGAAMPEVLSRAATLGLRACPLEAAPHFRLQYLDQPEDCRGTPAVRHRAPPGSITVVSDPLTDDDAFPKGFYVRRIDGVAWLRGYWSGPDHRWDPGDRLLFGW